MSSLVRRIQKGIAKQQGFIRKGEDIVNTDGDVIGKRWPQVKALTRDKK